MVVNSVKLPYSRKFARDKIFTDGSKNENSWIKFFADAGHCHVIERERLIHGFYFSGC